MPGSVPGTMNAGGGTGTPVDEAQQSMQLRRNQERERRAQHFGHRRSSSVPLPMDTYAHAAAYPYAHAHAYAFPPAFSAQAQANPFNFANPALASAGAGAGAGASSSAGAGANSNGVQQIALPTLPTMGADAGGSNGAGLSNLSNMLPAWYADTNNNTSASTEQHAQSLSAGATPASGELQLPSHLQGPFDTTSSTRPQHQTAATLSRAGSPRLAHSLRQQQTQQTQFAPQQGMGMLGNMALYNQMHMGFGMGMGMGPGGGMNTNGGMSSYMNMNTGMSMGMPMNSGIGMPLGMGARAARQHQLGQLGRRASSTQPVLQHQLASGAFAHFGIGAHANNNNAFSFTPTTAPALPPPSANVGFTNPFASSSASNNGAIGARGATGEGVNGFPHPFAPLSIWFDGGALPDPSGPGAGVGAEPEPLPEVDSYLLNPAFRFGTSSTDGASSTSTTANTTTTNNNNNNDNNNNNATSNNSNGTPPPPPSAGPRGSFDFTAIMMNLPRAGHGASTNNGGPGARGAGYAPHVDVSISPLENIPPHQQVPALAQPVPLRKVAVPVAEPEVYPTQEYAAPQQQEYHYAPHYVPHGQQQQHGQQLQGQGQGQGMELEYVYGGGGGGGAAHAHAHAHAQEYFQNSQPSSVASGSPDLSASGSGSPHGFGAMEMHSQESQTQTQSQSQESTPTEMRPLPPHQHAQDTVAGTELLDGAHPQQYEQQYEQYEQHPQQQFEHQSVYADSAPEPLSASLGGSMGVGVGAGAPGALGLYYDHQHQHQHQYQLEQQQQQQQQQQHGEDLQTYMSAAAGVCSGVDVLDNYALGLPLPLPLPVSVVDRHGHHAHGQAHGYADPASAGQGFEFSDFVHDSPYLGTGAMGAAAN